MEIRTFPSFEVSNTADDTVSLVGVKNFFHCSNGVELFKNPNVFNVVEGISQTVFTSGRV